MLALQISAAYAQDAVTAADSTSFDFWVGNWKLTWNDSDTSVAYGENTVTKIMDGKVVQENFVAHTGVSAGFKGTSVSVFDRADGKWRQTWVDNQSVYLEFTGGVRGENRFFERSFTGPKGTTVHQRMVFYNITGDAFDWDWERSTDNDSTWALGWRIHYERKKN